MKYITIFLLLLVTSTTWSQNKTPLSTPKGANLERAENVSSENNSSNQPQYVSAGEAEVVVERTVDYYDNYIAAVRSKIDWVKNNPAENKKAKKSGWFKEMELNIERAERERESLINTKE